MEEYKEPTLRDMQEELLQLKKLQETPGYTWLMKHAKRQVDRRVDIVMRPLRQDDGVYLQEFLKGEIAGVQTFMAFVSAQISILESQIAIELAKQEPDNED